MNNDRMHKIILAVTAVILVALAAYAVLIDSRYKYDFICLMALLLIVFWLRKKLFLHWAHFLFFCIFLIVHNWGVFGAYEWYPLGMEYDYWAHAFFGLVASMIIIRALRLCKFNLSTKTRILLVIAITLGLSAAHELYEFAGAIFLGEGEGVLFIGAGDLDEWDTQKDMLNNLIGCLFGLIFYGGITRIFRKPDDEWRL